MPDIDVIQDVLDSFGVEMAGDVISDADGLRRYFVSVSIARDRDNRQVPSNRLLVDVKRALAEQGIFTTFLLRDAAAQDLEAGLRATLLHSYIEHIRNVFLSVNGKSAHVWVEPKRELSADQNSEISRRAAEYLRLTDLELSAFSAMTDASLPSQLACMSAIRMLAPASMQAIMNHLAKKGFTIPSEHWLARRLDALRRANKVVRLESGLYALSAHGLQVMGTSKRSTSPDVGRMLAVAQRDG